MNPQLPAEGILLHKDFGDSKFYVVPCDCGNPDDEIRFEVEADDCGVTVHHWVKVKTDWWSNPTKFNFINRLWYRLKVTWTVWTKGYVEYESWTIMSRQQALNYAWTVNQATRDVEQFRKESKLKP